MIGISIEEEGEEEGEEEEEVGVAILAVELSLFLLLSAEDARVLILVVFASIAAGIVDVVTNGSCCRSAGEDEIVVLLGIDLTPLKNTV
jgi:hypothetical protein